MYNQAYREVEKSYDIWNDGGDTLIHEIEGIKIKSTDPLPMLRIALLAEYYYRF